MDEVDTIIGAWRQVRPDLDTSPLEVLSRVSRLAHRVAGVRQRVFAAHGLDAWEFDVLAALRRAGEPFELSPGQLAAETLVTSGTMTNRIDRLSERGYVRRVPSATDRRGVTVQLGPAGLDVVDAAFCDLVDAENRLLGGLSEEQRTALARHLRILLRSVAS